MGLVTITNGIADRYMEPDYALYKKAVEALVATKTSDGWAERVDFNKNAVKILYRTFIPTMTLLTFEVSYADFDAQFRRSKVDNLLVAALLESKGFVAAPDYAAEDHCEMNGEPHFRHPDLAYTFRVYKDEWLEQRFPNADYHTVCRAEEAELDQLIADPAYNSYCSN